MNKVIFVLINPNGGIIFIVIVKMKIINVNFIKKDRTPLMPKKRKKRKECICEHPYDIDEAILLDKRCPMHGDKKQCPP